MLSAFLHYKLLDVWHFVMMEDYWVLLDVEGTVPLRVNIVYTWLRHLWQEKLEYNGYKRTVGNFIM